MRHARPWISTRLHPFEVRRVANSVRPYANLLSHLGERVVLRLRTDGGRVSEPLVTRNNFVLVRVWKQSCSFNRLMDSCSRSINCMSWTDNNYIINVSEISSWKGSGRPAIQIRQVELRKDVTKRRPDRNSMFDVPRCKVCINGELDECAFIAREACHAHSVARHRSFEGVVLLPLYQPDGDGGFFLRPRAGVTARRET